MLTKEQKDRVLNEVAAIVQASALRPVTQEYKPANTQKP